MRELQFSLSVFVRSHGAQTGRQLSVAESNLELLILCLHLWDNEIT